MDAENRSVCPAQVSTTGYLFIYIRRTRISLFLPHRFVRTHDTILLLIIKLNNNRPFVKKLFKEGFLCFLLQVRRLFLFLDDRREPSVSHRSRSFVLLLSPSLSKESHILVEFDFDDLFASNIRANSFFFRANKMTKKKKRKK